MARTPTTADRLRLGALYGLAGALICLGLWFAGALDGIEARTWDMRVRLFAEPGPATHGVVLVRLDQASLDWAKNENGLSWPWPREMYAVVADFCRRAGAKALVFDMLFTEPSVYGVEDDHALRDAAAAFGRTAIPLFLSRAGTGAPSWPAAAPRPDFAVYGLDTWLARTGAATALSFSGATPPVADIASGAAMLGNVHIAPDPDTVYRRAPLFTLFDGAPVPSLALAGFLAGQRNMKRGVDPLASLAQGDLRLLGRNIPLDSRGNAILRFRGPSGTHAGHAAADVIRSELLLRDGLAPSLDPALLKDAYVVFGATAPGLLDLRPAPVSGVYPGFEIVATMLDNLIGGDFMRDASAWTVAAYGLLLAVLAAAALAMAGSATVGMAVHAGCAILPAALSCAVYPGGTWLPFVPPFLAANLAMGGVWLHKYVTEGRQRQFIKAAFSQYLSPQVIEQLMEHPERLKLGGERRVLSIFFSDLQGFTSLSEGLEPEELTALLNEYLTAMTAIIQEEGGTIDKYEGDAIIAFWNAPLDMADHGARAMRAAMRCHARLDAMRPAIRQRIGKDLFMRIGLNTGPAIVGNLGSDTRFDYSMLGDAVNLASRLEGANKAFGTYCMISDATRQAMDNAYPCRELARLAVAGRSAAVTVFEPMPAAAYAARQADLAIFRQGLELFYQGDFAAARQAFAQVADRDPAAKAYAAQCARLEADPPQGEWRGVWTMTGK
ncbi:MAG: CHASE2 domain-containing protein [Desulfovibrionaceae bacterium]